MEQSDQAETRKRTFLMRAKYYPRGGPKIVREELERLGLQWMPPTTPLST